MLYYWLGQVAVSGSRVEDSFIWGLRRFNIMSYEVIYRYSVLASYAIRLCRYYTKNQLSQIQIRINLVYCWFSFIRTYMKYKLQVLKLFLIWFYLNAGGGGSYTSWIKCWFSFIWTYMKFKLQVLMFLLIFLHLNAVEKQLHLSWTECWFSFIWTYMKNNLKVLRLFGVFFSFIRTYMTYKL